mmetsp:Transcript_11152/g.18493  ORF Transcript_11152/g.18493 Transcript_11152/m.18493 type:complete len:115 (-) Transcript_11152:120-464(-)
MIKIRPLIDYSAMVCCSSLTNKTKISKPKREPFTLGRSSNANAKPDLRERKRIDGKHNSEFTKRKSTISSIVIVQQQQQQQQIGNRSCYPSLSDAQLSWHPRKLLWLARYSSRA